MFLVLPAIKNSGFSPEYSRKRGYCIFLGVACVVSYL